MDMAIVVNQVDVISVFTDDDDGITISQHNSGGGVQLIRFHSESVDAVINGILTAQKEIDNKVVPAQPCGRVG